MNVVFKLVPNSSETTGVSVWIPFRFQFGTIKLLLLRCVEYSKRKCRLRSSLFIIFHIFLNVAAVVLIVDHRWVPSSAQHYVVGVQHALQFE